MKEQTKICPRCGTRKPLTDFNRNCSRPDGHQVECRQCMRDRWRDPRGGIPHLLQRLTDEELAGEVVRRGAAQIVLAAVTMKSLHEGMRPDCLTERAAHAAAQSRKP